jgi:hypothetical protein
MVLPGRDATAPLLFAGNGLLFFHFVWRQFVILILELV